jgi:hypothetical protein
MDAAATKDSVRAHLFLRFVYVGDKASKYQASKRRKPLTKEDFKALREDLRRLSLCNPKNLNTKYSHAFPGAVDMCWPEQDVNSVRVLSMSILYALLISVGIYNWHEDTG